MKIAYLLHWDPYNESGVLNKISDKKRQWEHEGHEVTIISVWPLKDEATVVQAHVAGFKLEALGPFSVFVNKVLTYRKVISFLRGGNFDVIYFRQSSWHPFLIRILRSKPSVLEVNTLDKEEIKTQNVLSKILFYLGRKKILTSVRGIITVSNEIKRSLEKEVQKPITVIANGIKVDLATAASERTSGMPQVIFVGSPGLLWHGVDKLEWLIANCSDFYFHIVGYSSVAHYPNAKFYGVLKKSELEELYKVAHVGIGSLALHRINMFEASTLKVREYIAQDVPVILPYEDTDIAAHPAVLQIPNCELNLRENISAIREFVLKAYNGEVRVDGQLKTMVSAVEKEKTRMKFIKDVVIP